MAITCWPLDGKEYTAADLGAAYAVRGRGVLNSNAWSAHTNNNLTVTVGPGVGCIKVNEWWGAYPRTGQDTVLTFPASHGSLNRYDTIVVTYDKSLNEARLGVRTGTAAAKPSIATPRRNTSYDEITLYAVYRPAGSTTIRASDLQDLRLDSVYCGLMADSIDNLDTSVMAAQLQNLIADIRIQLDQLQASEACCLKTEYDPTGVVRQAGGIAGYAMSNNGGTASGKISVLAAEGNSLLEAQSSNGTHRLQLYANTDGAVGLWRANGTGGMGVLSVNANGAVLYAGGQLGAGTKMAAAPTEDMHPATKKYVDDAIKTALVGYMKVKSFSGGKLVTES